MLVLLFLRRRAVPDRHDWNMVPPGWPVANRPDDPGPPTGFRPILFTMKRVVPQNPPGSSGLARHPALVGLSRDHHFALRQALWLRRAADAPSAEAAAGVARAYLEFYRTALLDHFSDEEVVLLPLAGHADPDGADRIRAEHEELHGTTAALRDALAGGSDPRPAAREIGHLLDDHVRFEERAFFMKVQAHLSPAALDDLDRALRERRDARRGPG
jgi:hypothetical protein